MELKSPRLSPDDQKLIDSLRETVPPQILGHYDRLRNRGKKGVALARNNVCSECHMRIPTGVIATLMQGADVQLCGNCGRYLHLPEPDPAEAREQTPVAKPAPRKKRARAARVPALVD